MTQILVYEDSGWLNLLPLVYTRAVFELVCGMGSLLDRVKSIGAMPTGVWCRAELAAVIAERTVLPANVPIAGSTLLLNGRVLWSEIPATRPGEGAWVGVTEGPHPQVACVFAEGEALAGLSAEIMLDPAKLDRALAAFPRRVIAGAKLIAWPWNLIHAHPGALVEDWRLRATADRDGARIDAGSHLLGNDIHLGSGTRIKPCVVIDAEDGPVWIGENVTIMPHSYVQGPAYIGSGSLLQTGAVVRAGTRIGPVCKVGGEIEGSIVHGFSNKQHDGFLGHSYIGEWINIAADCINSDLKNTYGTVRVPINGREVESGEMFVGMIVGDHSKIGINVSLPTGAVLGFNSAVFSPKAPKFVPSFGWLEETRLVRYDVEKAFAVAQKVMARRKHTMSEAEAALFRNTQPRAERIEVVW